MKLFNRPPKHKHDWNLIDKTVLPGKTFGKFEGWGPQLDKLLELMKDKVVLTFKCDCGEVRIEKRP